MITRITAGAFLVYGNKILLMKRGLHKEMSAGMWAGIGGHMELADIDNLRALKLIKTCYREVKEETGIKKSQIKNLKLRYVAVRQVENEIRMHYHYLGEVENEFPLPSCNEGELHWVEKNDVPDLPMSITVSEAIKHWFHSPDNEGIFFITVNPAGDCAVVSEI